MSKAIIALLLVGIVVAGYLWFCPPALDTGELEEMLDIFERKTASMRQGRFNYPLPHLDNGRAEVEYLSDLAGILTVPQADCSGVGQQIEKRFEVFQKRNSRSVFHHAAYLLKRRQGADWVHATSQEISDAPITFTRRIRVEPLEADKKFEILKEKTDKIDLVANAQAALRQVIDRAGPFADECPEQAEGLTSALDYFLPDVKR